MKSVTKKLKNGEEVQIIYSRLPFMFFLLGLGIFMGISFLLCTPIYLFVNKLLFLEVFLGINLIFAIVYGFTLLHHKVIYYTNNRAIIWYGLYKVEFEANSILNTAIFNLKNPDEIDVINRFKDKLKWCECDCILYGSDNENDSRNYWFFVPDRKRQEAKEKRKQEKIYQKKLEQDTTDYPALLKSYEKNSIHFKYTKKQTFSKLGGKPDVPEDFEWPMFEGKDDYTPSYRAKKLRPLTFICQIDFEEIAPFDKENILPKNGILSLFYDNIWTPIARPGEENGLKVYYFPDKNKLKPSKFTYPKKEWEDDVFRFFILQKHIQFYSFTEVPRILELDKLSGKDLLDELYDKAYEENGYKVNDRYEYGVDKMLGWEDNWNRVDMPNPNEYVLLFQIIASEFTDIKIGVDGHIHVYISKQDLKNKNFNNIKYAVDYT